MKTYKAIMTSMTYDLCVLCVPTQVNKAIEQERIKWEAEKEEALEVHCGILEEQNRESLERMRDEVEREKRNALALQDKVVELQTVS